jgi:CTP synthase (UTP-ammonia lyase)
MLKVAVLGDFNPNVETHVATNVSLDIAREQYNIPVATVWLPTAQINVAEILGFDAVIIGTGVYEDRSKVLDAIEIAREGKIPTLGACGGFQFMIIEFARNVLGISEAAHAEFDVESAEQVIVPLSCSLRGQEHKISVVRDSQVGRLYETGDTTEKFYCGFGIGADYVDALQGGGLRVVGSDGAGTVRIVELPGHPFFVGTLFVPQARAIRGECHPLILGLLAAAAVRQRASQPEPYSRSLGG